MTEWTPVHNTCDGACLKGYRHYFKLGQLETVRREEAVLLDVYHLNSVFCLSLSETTWIRVASVWHTSARRMRAEEQWADLQSAMFLASRRAIQSAQLPLLVTLCLNVHANARAALCQNHLTVLVNQTKKMLLFM